METSLYIKGVELPTSSFLNTNYLSKTNSTAYMPSAQYHPATKKYVDDCIAAINQLHFEIVEELPQVGEPTIIYMILADDGEGEDYYDEYIYINNTWEKIGSTRIDLTPYATIDYVDDITEQVYGQLQNIQDQVDDLDLSKQDVIQYSIMPTEVSAGTIVQYVGENTDNYTNGYFYKRGEEQYRECASIRNLSGYPSQIKLPDAYNFALNGDKMEFKFAISGSIAGNQTTMFRNYPFTIYLVRSGAKYWVRGGDNSTLDFNAPYVANEVHTLVVNDGNNYDAYWDNTLVGSGMTENEWDYTRIFNGDPYTVGANGTFYCLKIWDHDTNELMHDLRPAQRVGDNAYGVYDIITHEFYIWEEVVSGYMEVGEYTGNTYREMFWERADAQPSVDLTPYATIDYVDSNTKYYSCSITHAFNETSNQMYLRQTTEINSISQAITDAYQGGEHVLHLKLNWTNGVEFLTFTQKDLQQKPTGMALYWFAINGYPRLFYIAGSWSGNTFTCNNETRIECYGTQAFGFGDSSLFRYGVQQKDVLTKNNTTAFTPTDDYHPATKKYVDDSAVELPKYYVLAHGSYNNEIPTSQYSKLVEMVNYYLKYNSWPCVSWNSDSGCNVPVMNVNINETTNYIGITFYLGLTPAGSNSGTSWGISYRYLYGGSAFTIYVNPSEFEAGEVSNVYSDAALQQQTRISVGYSGGGVARVMAPSTNLPLGTTNTVAFTPTGDYNPATKKYVDDNIPPIGDYVWDLTPKGNITTMFSGGFAFTADDQTAISNIINDYYAKHNTVKGLSIQLKGDTNNVGVMTLTQNGGRGDSTGIVFVARYEIGEGLLYNDSYVLTGTWSNNVFSCTTTYFRPFPWNGYTLLSYNNLLQTGKAATISGKFTYNTLPESSIAPTTDNQFANKKYVDDVTAGAGAVLGTHTKSRNIDGNIIAIHTYSIAGPNWADLVQAPVSHDTWKPMFIEIFNDALQYYDEDAALNEIVLIYAQSQSFGTFVFEWTTKYPTTGGLYNWNMQASVRNSCDNIQRAAFYISDITFDDNILTDIEFSSAFSAVAFLGTNNSEVYTPTNDYNPATKKYVDDSIPKIVALTQSEYDALDPPDPDTYYFIKES